MDENSSQSGCSYENIHPMCCFVVAIVYFIFWHVKLYILDATGIEIDGDLDMK